MQLALGPVWLIACCLPLPEPLASVPMLGVDTRAMSKAKMGYKAVDASGSHKKVYISEFYVDRIHIKFLRAARSTGELRALPRRR